MLNMKSMSHYDKNFPLNHLIAFYKFHQTVYSCTDHSTIPNGYNFTET